MNHTQVGDITEQRFILYCMERNIPISKPLNNNLPYDSIIEVNGELLKVQIKTGYENDVEYGFMFNTRSTSKNYTEITNKNYIGLIDGFVTWYKDLPDKFFYIPIEEASSGCMNMYYGDNPKSNQNYVYDYDFDNLI